MEKAALKRRSGSDSRNLAAIEDEDEETLTEDDEDGDEDAEEEADLDEAPFAAGDDFWCCESAAADDEGEPSSEMVIGDRSKVETRRVVTNIA